MNFQENPNNQKEKTSLSPEKSASPKEIASVAAVEMVSDDTAQKIEEEDAKKIQKIQRALRIDASPKPVGNADATPVDSREDRLRRLENAAKFSAINTFYEKSSDDFLRRLGLPEKKHMAMYAKHVEDDDRALIGDQTLTEKQKKWYLKHKADAKARLNDMNLAQGMTRQRIIDGIEKQRYQQQNGYGIADRVRGRFQAWRLGRQLKNFDATIEQYKQKTIEEKGDFYQ